MLGTLLRGMGTLIGWTARLGPAVAVGSLFFALDGGLKWLGLLGLPLLLLALRHRNLGCGPRGCNLAGEKVPGHWPAP